MATFTETDDVSAEQLKRYARLIYDKIGITISPQKSTLLSNRLRRRLRATGLDCYDEYFERLRATRSDDPEWEAFLQEVTTHETYLFRDQSHWDWLRNSFVPEMVAGVRSGKRKPTIRVWSAACSTGDEAYTIASCLADRLTATPGWQVQILGTDIGAGAVAQARNPVFGERAMRLVPEPYRRRFFERAADGSGHAPKQVLRDMVRFQTHNLLEPLKQPGFDLVVLKNVLIYFDAQSKRRVLEHLKRAILPGGALITGPAEGVSDLLAGLKSTHGWLHRMPDKK